MRKRRALLYRGVVSISVLLLMGWACLGSTLPAQKTVSPADEPTKATAERPDLPACGKLSISRRLWVGFFGEMKLRWARTAAGHVRSLGLWLRERCAREGRNRFDVLHCAGTGLEVSRVEFCDGDMERARVTLNVVDRQGEETGAVALWVDREHQGWRIGPQGDATLPAVGPDPEPPPPECAAR